MSLEVYIDNEKIEIKKKYKTLGMAIRDINEKLIKDRKITTHVIVNGEELSEKTCMYSAKNILEIKTKKESTIILEGLYNMKEYTFKYFELIEELESIDESESDECLQEMLNITSWFIKHLISVKNFSTIDMLESEFDENLNQLQDSYMEMEDAFQQGDIDIILEVLEYEVAKVMIELQKKAEYYIVHFIDDQARTEFLN
ncbi:MAG: hypothetical protein ACRCZ2_06345 [Fusobacteriaceae bacterium]